MAATWGTTKAQGATLDYQVPLANGDTIASAAWTVTGATKVSETSSTTAASVRVSGGTVGTPAKLVCHIVGASGLEYERTIELAKCQRVRALSDGEWFNAYIHPDY